MIYLSASKERYGDTENFRGDAMSISRDMKRYMLQQKKVVKTISGAESVTWHDVSYIDAAVYKKNDFKTVISEKYIKATHTGLTKYRNICAGRYRLIGDGLIYDITDCNTEGRLTNLLLEVIKNA